MKCSFRTFLKTTWIQHSYLLKWFGAKAYCAARATDPIQRYKVAVLTALRRFLPTPSKPSRAFLLSLSKAPRRVKQTPFKSNARRVLQTSLKCCRVSWHTKTRLKSAAFYNATRRLLKVPPRCVTLRSVSVGSRAKALKSGLTYLKSKAYIKWKRDDPQAGPSGWWCGLEIGSAAQRAIVWQSEPWFGTEIHGSAQRSMVRHRDPWCRPARYLRHAPSVRY